MTNLIPSAASDPLSADVFKSLHSEAVLLVRESDLHVMLEKDADKPLFPASLTKLMTALLLAERSSAKEKVRIPDAEYQHLREANAAMAGYRPGERRSRNDILRGILMPSGAECALAAAVHVSGSESAFVKEMNERAARLGMVSTHYENCTGVHHPLHVSSARDTMLLLDEVLEQPELRKAMSAPFYPILPCRHHPLGGYIRSTMCVRGRKERFSGGIIEGGKTGYTEQAGQCLACFAKVKGQEFRLVLLHADGDYDKGRRHFEDASRLFSALAKTPEYELEV